MKDDAFVDTSLLDFSRHIDLCNLQSWKRPEGTVDDKVPTGSDRAVEVRNECNTGLWSKPEP